MKDNAPSLFPNPAVAARVLEYAAANSNTLPEPLLQYHAQILQLEAANMSISTFQGQALSFLAQVAGTRRVLEIGVFRGFSSMVWAHAVGPHGKVTGLEKFPAYADFARTAYAEAGFANIEVVVGDALETLHALDPEEPYDLVFVDAQKSEYPAYLQAILDKSAPGASRRLLRPGGLIVADNVLRSGLVVDSRPDNLPAGGAAAKASKTFNKSGHYSPDDELEGLDRFNAALKDSERVDAWLVPLFDGIGLGRLLD